MYLFLIQFITHAILDFVIDDEFKVLYYWRCKDKQKNNYLQTL